MLKAKDFRHAAWEKLRGKWGTMAIAALIYSLIMVACGFLSYIYIGWIATLLLAGAFACVGQLGITKAYVCAPAREISVYDYTQVLFAAALGFFVFGDVPDWLSVLGYVLICGAGVGMFLYNRRHDAAHP